MPRKTPRRYDRRWNEREYEILFGQFPPEGGAPSGAALATIAADFERTEDAVRWQWTDGASYSMGREASTASGPLKAWLDRRDHRR